MSFSQYNSKLTLEGLRYQPEGQYLERKGRDVKAAKIANELIGMLNAGGGTLVYGITKDGQIEDLAHLGGLLPTEPAKLDAYRKLVHDLIVPPANITQEEIYLEGRELIFLYHVDQDYERLFQRRENEAVYLRVADANKGPLSRDEVKKLEYDKAIRSFEDEIREDFDPEDLDRNACENYRTAMRFEGSFEELAVKRNLAVKRDNRMLFKNAAILLFAVDPEKYIPNASVRYVRYSGTARKSGAEFNVVKDQRFESGIPGLVQLLEAFIEASLSAMQEGMLAKPEYTDENNTVTLTLRNRVTEHKETIFSEVLELISSNWMSLNGSQRHIISILFENQEATIAQMADKMELTKTSVRYNLRKLEKAGILERISEKIRDPQALYRFRSG